MRSILAIALFLTAAAPALAQDAKHPFTGSGNTEAKACAIAKADAERWVKAGKKEGRHREIAKIGECAFPPSGGAITCPIGGPLRDEVYEEEEEH